jgi:hypothetical protein
MIRTRIAIEALIGALATVAGFWGAVHVRIGPCAPVGMATHCRLSIRAPGDIDNSVLSGVVAALAVGGALSAAWYRQRMDR